MRWMTFALVVTTLSVCLPGCSDGGGPSAGMPTDVPSGPPPLPPGTSKEMTKGPNKAVPRPPV